MKIYSPEITGSLRVSGSIIPEGSGSHDLGSVTHPFRDLYVTQNSIKFIDTTTREEISRISVNRQTGEIKLLRTKGFTEEEKASITGDTATFSTLSPFTASAILVSQSITPGHELTTLGHSDAKFHTLYVQHLNFTGNFVGTGSLEISGSLSNGEEYRGVYQLLKFDEGFNGTPSSNEVLISLDSDYLKNYLNSQTVISGSEQITSLPSVDTGDLAEGSNLYYTDARVKTKLNTEGVISGSIQVSHDSTTGFVANEHIDHSEVSITAGSGLTGGGDITTSRTLNIGEGTGITVSADSISTNDSEIVHDNLSGFVANEHIDHSGVTLTAGNGLTGGGDITTGRSFAVGQGDGISVGSDSVAVDSTVVRTSGTQTVGGDKTFSNNITIQGNLQVTGTTTTVNSTTVSIADSIIEINGTGAVNGGLLVKDITSPGIASGSLLWDGTGNYWKAGTLGSENRVLTTADEGSGNGLDADTLDGQEGSYYTNASNINAGTIGDAYLPGTISSDITGNSATTTKWATARTITLGGDLSGNVSLDGSANVTLTAAVADDSHTHDGRYFTETESDARFLGISAKAADSNLLDGIDSTSFLRSDADDTTTGIITLAKGSTGTLMSRTGFSDAVGYNDAYGMYIGGGGSNATRYLYAGGYLYDGTTVRTLLHSANYYSYSPTLTGTGASGTWGISITGNADTVDSLHASSFLRSDANDSFTGTLTTGELQIFSSHPVHTGYSGIANTQAWTTTTEQYMIISAGTDTYVNGDNVYIRAGNNSSTNELKVSTGGVTIGGNTALHAGNYNSYSPTLTGGNASGTWGISITGNAATATNSSQLGGISSNRAILKRRTRIHSSDGTSLNSSITAPEMGFTYGGSGEPTGPFIAFGGLGGNIDYSMQFVGAYSGGGNDFKVRTRNDDVGSWNSWRTILTDGNYNSYAPTLTGGNASGTWGISITGNADTVDNLHASSFWQAGGSWGADLTSNGFTRQIGVSYTGGEFVILTNNAQISTLIDGNYFAGEQGGFYSMNSSNQYSSRVGFNRDGSGNVSFNASIVPNSNGTLNLGSSSARWNTVYTSDLSMSNGIGDYTIVEGEEDLFLYNNKNGKVYKFVIQEVDPSTVPPKKE